MRRKNYLFFLSLVLIVGCTAPEVNHSTCKADADSMAQVHGQLVDSLRTVINGLDLKTQQLEERSQALADSLAAVPIKKVGPVRPPPQPKGDPIKDGDK